MNKYLSTWGYYGPNILLALILLTLAYERVTDPYLYAMVIAWQMLNHLLNVIFKNIIQAPRPDSHKDPQFAHLKPNIANFMTIHREYGMPSGHAQEIVSELIFIALYFQNPWLTVCAFGQAVLTIWQRYATRRHSAKQLIAGSSLGIIIGLIFYNIFPGLPNRPEITVL